MISGQGDTIPGCTLTEGNTAVTSGNFLACNVIECVADGAVLVTWKSGSTQTVTYTTGWVSPIDCKSIEVISGTWNIGWI